MRKNIVLCFVALVLVAQPLPQSGAPLSSRQASAADPSADASTRRDSLRTFDLATAKLVERREGADIYEAADGSRIAMLYASKANWKDASGTWRPIDTRLVDSEEASFRNASGPLKVRFSGATGAGPLASVSRDNWSVAFSLEGATPRRSGVVSGSTIIYSDVTDGVDLEYQAEAEALKEVVVLKQRRPAGAPDRFRFPLTLSGVEPKVQADGTISFHDSSGKQVAFIPPSFMTDASASAVADAAWRPVSVCASRTDASFMGRIFDKVDGETQDDGLT